MNSAIAFYAPTKPPDHPIPSGERLIAQNLMAALELAGNTVTLTSRYVSYSKRENAEVLAERKAGALAEADAVIESLRSEPPDLWITYHPYCKSPDWIGPRVADAFGIPYINIEAVRTGQGFEDGGDRWKHWRAEAQNGIRRADHHLAFTPRDRAYLTELLGDAAKISDIPPFIDTAIPDDLPAIVYPSHWRPNAPTLIAAGMMRPGKKVRNFEVLADALMPLQALHWNLVIIGGGPEEDTVRSFFTPFEDDRLLFTGGISHAEVLSHMAAGDLFVWPGWKEPIGMVYLEAQLMGLPVAALDSMGVSLTVYHGETGLLASEDDHAAFTDNLMNLISHPTLRRDLGAEARKSVNARHSLQAGAQALQAALAPFLSPSLRSQ